MTGTISKLAATAALAFVMSAGLAVAADDPFVDLYSNTLVYTTPKKVETKVLVQKDGTWTSTSSDKKASGGSWAVLGNWVCVSNSKKPKTKPACSKAESHAVGDKWTEKTAAGTDHVTLVAGR